jgi:RNA polymerase sigma-70 factor (ECF subfamily)
LPPQLGKNALPSGATSIHGAVTLDPDSRSWVEALGATGEPREAAIADLRALLLRSARREVSRRRSLLRIGGAELDDLAHQAADDALVAILAKLAQFRGESRFTTWAYKFVLFEVSGKVGRHFSRARAGSIDDVDWERLPDRLGVGPDRRAEQNELFHALRLAVEEELTDHQRRVFVAVALNEVPMDALVHELRSNRNAVYKTLFDARRKLRASLAAAGHPLPGGGA